MNVSFHSIDWLLFLLYFILLLWLSWRHGWQDDSEEQFLLSGRRLTLPAFVATLVATWYGGILGAGEFSYQFGLSQWLVMGFPYYIFSALFAVFLAGKIRMNRALSIPEAVANRYGKHAGKISAIPVFILVSPAPYILMLGMLLQAITGGSAPYLFYAAVVALFSVLYVSVGGFNAVVRTDMLQIVLMYGGFILLLIYAIAEAGNPLQLLQVVPDEFRDLTGGHSWQYLLVWFFIALWTFVDPGFHQRAAAAESPELARKGIFISIMLWSLFDFLTVFSGMYGWAILGPDLSEPALVYPILGDLLLPAGLKGLFFLAMLATIMSTLDSFLFLSGQTLGRDLLAEWFPNVRRNVLTRSGILISALLGLLLIIIYPSVIDLWYVLGSVLIPGLLVPILGIYIPYFRLNQPWATISMVGCTGLSLFWLILGSLVQTEAYSYAFLGIEPFYPGLLLAVVIWTVGRKKIPAELETAEEEAGQDVVEREE